MELDVLPTSAKIYIPLKLDKNRMELDVLPTSAKIYIPLKLDKNCC